MRIPFQFVLLATLASALAARAALVPAPNDQEEPSIAANGNSTFVVWADKRNYNSTEYDIYGSRVSSSGEVLDPGGIAICTDPGRQTSPRVAFDGERYLVVWEDDRESTIGFQLYQIYGARVTTGGQVLDVNGFKITTNRVTRLGPAVVSNGHGFFVAWEDWHRANDVISDVYGSPVSSGGIVANPDGIPLVLGAGWQVQPRLAFANGEYLMTYRDNGPLGGPDIWGIRVSIDGQTNSTAFRISNSNNESGGRYGLASNGRDCLVVWGDNRGSPSGFGYPKIYGTLVQSNGVVASPNGIPIATNALYQDRPRIASDGNDFLVVWQESNDAHSEFTDIYAATLTGAGALGTPARIAINRAPGVQFNPDVAFTAGNYLVAWQDGRGSPNNTYPLGAYDIFGTLVTGTGAVSATNGFLISGAQPNAPPTVAIVNPRDGDTFTAPVNILLMASVHDEDGLAAQTTVEFFDGADRVAAGQLTDPGPPHDAAFRFFWTNVPVGEHTLTAEVTDDRGAQTTSSPVKIIVRSGRPIVNVEALKDAVEIGDSKSRALIFRVTRTGPFDFDLPVSYRVGGTAQNGLDYEELSGRLIIPAGATDASILTYARSDGISEGDETVEVAIERPSCIDIFPPPRECYEVGEHGAARGLIHDAPALLPRVSLELVDAGAAETLVFQNNIDWAEFRVLRTGDLTRELFVFLDTQQGSARLGEDYRLDGASNGSTVRIPAGANSVNVRLYPIDDDFYEGDETVFLHLLAPPSSSVPYEIDFAHSSVAMVIHDNDPVTTRLEITAPQDGQHFQPGDTIELRAQIVGPGSTNSWSVEFFEGDRRLGTTRPGAPIWWGDASGGQHIIRARATDPQGTVLTSVPPTTIQVGPGAALPVVTIGAPAWRTGEPCPTCFVAPGILTIERTAPTNTGLTVFLEISGTATAGDDYQALPANVDIPAGQRSAQLTLLARDDQLAEGPEIVRVRVLPQPPPLLPPTYFVNVHAKEAMVVIFDDELNAPQARLDIVAPANGSHLEFQATVELSALAVYTQNEVYGPVEFYAGDQLVARSTVTATTQPAVPGLPSVHTAYWTNPPVGQHVLTARTQLSSSQSITSPPVNVTVDLPQYPVVRLETFPLQNPQAPEFCPPNADCAYPSFVVRRTGPTDADLLVYLSYSGTATAGADYPVLPESFVIPSGRDAAFLTLVPKDDTLVEGPETVIARFTPVPGPGYIQDPDRSSATITIIDNERPLDTIVSIGVDDPIASETSMLTVIDPARFRISRTGDLTRDLLVFFSLHGSATPGQDYQELNSSIGIPAGQSSVTFDVTPKFDQLAEGMETVYVRLEQSPLAGPLPTYEIARASRDAVAVILDNGSFPTPGLEIVRPEEGDRFTPPASVEILAAAYHPTNDVNHVDFYAGATKIGESTVIFDRPFSGGLIVHRFTWNNPPPGVYLLTARGFDGSESPVLTSKPVRITVGSETPRSVVSISATQRIAEESSAPFRRLNLVGEFTIARTGPTNNILSVFVQYSGMANRGADYPLLPQLVTIPSGSVSTVIRVEAINDHVLEGIETIVATLSHCGPGTDPPTGILCIDGLEIDPAHQSATVFIRDDGITEASLAITRPPDGTAFNTGVAIPIEAVAIDLNGYSSRVEFWDGEQRIGVSEIVFIRAPDPGTPIQHSFAWQGAAPGPHVLTARTVRADGTAFQSPPVHITVGSLPPADREFHAIDIYSGVTTNGGPSRNNERGEAAVVVNRPGKKVTLFLTSYEPVWWHVSVGNATIIEKVILGGYYRQEIDGIGAGVEIINAYYDEGHGTSNYLWPGTSLDSGRFFRVLQKLCDLVGMDLASFQGSYTAPYPMPIVIDQVQNDPRLRCDYPQPVDLSQLPDIRFRLAFHSGELTGSPFFQDFTLQGGVDASKLLPAWRVVTDADGRYYYGADFHRIWKVDSQTGSSQELKIPSNLPEFSWPVGIAFDSLRNRILVATLAGEGYLYAYSPAAGVWSLVRSLENKDLDSLAYHAANDSLYGVTAAYYDGGKPSLLRLNANGEVMGEIPLPVQPYGVGSGGFRSELVSVGEYLVLLLETGDWVVDNGRPEARIYLIDPRNGQVSLTYRKVESRPNRPPTITLLTPSSGTIFNDGADILLGANVTDPDGDTSRAKVEFFANGRKIGDAGGPNTSPTSWVLTWSNVAAGEYSLTAKVTDILGATALSAPVQIKVTFGLPILRIEATSSIAEEDSQPLERLPFAGEFTISRTGPTNVPLSTFVEYSGLATPGVDYPNLPWMVTIPAGAVSTKIRVAPNNDQVPEGIETLVATISNCPPLTDPPLGMPCFAWEIDTAHEQATLFIRDDGTASASLTITRPKDGAAFGSENPILIEALAIDLNGYISAVEFWDGEQKIGDSILDFFRAPDPGTPIEHSLAWRNASPGPHVLTARAIRADGSVLRSAPVHITVGSGSLPTVDVAVRDAFAVEPRTNADLDSATFGIRRVGPTNADLVVSYSLQGTAGNGIDYEKLSGETVIPAGQRSVGVTIRPLPDNLTEQDETVILRLEDSPGEQPRYYVGLQRRAVALISDNAPEPSSAGPQYLSLANGLPHICFAAESGRTYRIEASSDLRHWENVGLATASGGALHFVDPETTNIRCRFYRLAPEPITFTDE